MGDLHARLVLERCPMLAAYLAGLTSPEVEDEYEEAVQQEGPGDLAPAVVDACHSVLWQRARRGDPYAADFVIDPFGEDRR